MRLLKGNKTEYGEFNINTVKIGKPKQKGTVARLSVIDDFCRYIIGIKYTAGKQAHSDASGIPDIDTICIPQGYFPTDFTDVLAVSGNDAIYYNNPSFKNGFALIRLDEDELKKGLDPDADYFYMNILDVRQGISVFYMNVYREDKVPAFNLCNYDPENDNKDYVTAEVSLYQVDYYDNLELVWGSKVEIPAAYKGKNPDFLIVESNDKEVLVKARKNF